MKVKKRVATHTKLPSSMFWKASAEAFTVENWMDHNFFWINMHEQNLKGILDMSSDCDTKELFIEIIFYDSAA